MPDRARIAIPELELPEINLARREDGVYLIRARWVMPGIAPLLIGALRAMGDDYGALVTLTLDGVSDGWENLTVEVFDPSYFDGRSFDLGQAHA